MGIFDEWDKKSKTQIGKELRRPVKLKRPKKKRDYTKLKHAVKSAGVSAAFALGVPHTEKERQSNIKKNKKTTKTIMKKLKKRLIW